MSPCKFTGLTGLHIIFLSICFCPSVCLSVASFLANKSVHNIENNVIMPPPLIGGAIKRWCCLTSNVRLSVCLSRISGLNREQRGLGRSKIGTEVAHVTSDSDTIFKVKRSKVKVTRPLCSPPCWRVRRLHRWACERVGRGKLLLRCLLLGGVRLFGAHRGR